MLLRCQLKLGHRSSLKKKKLIGAGVLGCSPVEQGSSLSNTYSSLSVTLPTFLELWSFIPLPKRKRKKEDIDSSRSFMQNHNEKEKDIHKVYIRVRIN